MMSGRALCRRRFLCNVCDMPNEVPVDYFAGLDQAGRRLDEAQRPELGQGSVEYVAPQEYMVRSRPWGLKPHYEVSNRDTAWRCRMSGCR